MSCLIDKILSIKKNDIYGDIGSITDEINEIVYQIYDLTDKEIEEIISWDKYDNSLFINSCILSILSNKINVYL